MDESHFGGKAQTSKSRQSLSIGLTATVPFTFTLTRQTKPFLSGRTSTTLPRGHVLRGEFSALTRNISPKAKFLRGEVHFCLFWSKGRYSLDHRFQKMLARYRDRAAIQDTFYFTERVARLSMLVICIWSDAGRILRVMQIQCSQTPPQYDPYGGLNIHLIFFCNRASWILLWLRWWIS